MSLSIFAPLFYLIIGFGFGRTPYEIKGRASAWLTKLVIPFVIVYNIAANHSGVFVVMAGTMAMMSVMLLLSRAMTTDPVRNLCFCYLNIGWLGLPVASALFGERAATVIIAAYVGSSVFGNSVGAGLMAQGEDLTTRLRKTLQAPPVLALLAGVACMPLGALMEPYVKPLYDIMKFMMSFLGMAILGIWLSQTSLKMADFKKELMPFCIRAVTAFCLISLFILVCRHFGVALVTENQTTLYLLCLLPPAANIVVLETHYLKSGRSAAMIACGTCLSIVAIFLYVGVVFQLR